jgi:ABC-type methionine transport system ATPase subunit
MNREETEDMARYINDIRSDLHIPMIMIDHDMGLVMDLADRVLVVDFGTPIALGTARQVQTDPHVIAAYLGDDGEPVTSAPAGTDQSPARPATTADPDAPARRHVVRTGEPHAEGADT